MQDGATPHRTKEVFEAIYNVYGNRVIGLGHPKFVYGRIELPPYSPDLNRCDFFFWHYIKITVIPEIQQQQKNWWKLLEKM